MFIYSIISITRTIIATYNGFSCEHVSYIRYNLYDCSNAWMSHIKCTNNTYKYIHKQLYNLCSDSNSKRNRNPIA